jgi:hypothetical protein
MPINTYVGDLGTPFIFTLTLVDGSHPNLTGFVNANFRLHLYNQASNLIVVCSAGTWTIISGTGGIAQYQPVVADLATAGLFQVYLSVQIGGIAGNWKTFQPDTINILILE